MQQDKELSIFVVDAFTRSLFSGNPAGVCISEKNIEDKLKLQIAREMKHSETAFICNIDKENHIYGLTWWTPLTEVKLCGHATLASAYVLFSQNPHSTKMTFKTLSGDLIVTKKDELFQLDFPRGNCSPITLPEETKQNLKSALNLDPSDIIENSYDPVSGKLILEVSHYNAIKNLQPNSNRLLSVPFPVNVRGISVSTTNMEGSHFKEAYDFASRYFAPWVGIDEDPVNGSSHTILGTYYAKKLNKTKFLAYMASERSGVIGVELSGENRVLLEGSATLTLSGRIRIN